MNRKSCIGCAFLVRHEETYNSVSLKPELSRWINIEKSLDSECRKFIQKDDLSFLGKGLRDYQKWNKEYQAIIAEKQKTSIFAISPMHSILNNMPSDEELAELGLEPAPEYNDYDYLGCYHEQWSEDRKRENPVDKAFLSTKSCSFYFPLKKMDRKSLEACEKTRSHERNRIRFFITNMLVILGISSTFLLSQDVRGYLTQQYELVKKETSSFFENAIKKVGK